MRGLSKSVATLALLGLASLPGADSVDADGSADVCTTPICKSLATGLLNSLAKNYKQVDPCTDFDVYACEGWRETHEYKPEEASLNAMSLLSREHQTLLRSILESPFTEVEGAKFSPAQQDANRANFAKLKAAYDTCMDEDAMKTVGVKPVQDILAAFEDVYPRSGSSIGTKEELTNTLVWLAKRFSTGFIGGGTTSDNKIPELVVLTLGAPGLQIPKQQYSKAAIVANLTKTVADMMHVIKSGSSLQEDTVPAGSTDELRQRADGLVQFEKVLAKEIATPEKSRVIDYNYQVVPLTLIDGLVPEISITDYFKALVPEGYSMTSNSTAVVRDMDYFRKLSSVLRSTTRETLHDYFRWHLIGSYAGNLHRDFKIPLRRFQNVRSGKDETALAERWRICVSEVDENLGYLLGSAFIQRVFPKEYKDLGDRIVREIRDIFTKRFDELDWMSKDVKAKAAKKVENIRQRLGYQDAKPDNADPLSVFEYYANLTTSKKTYFDLHLAYTEVKRTRQWNSLLAPTDFNKFTMSPPTVNAYFSGTFNSINFPAGYLQPPFFSPDLPEYVSYGSFGAGAGHELTHAFDTRGARFDERGALRDWWDNGTRTRFEELAECFVKQYDKFTVTDEEGKPMNVNGKLTLEENIADAGGIASAYAAWKLRETQKKSQGLPGLEGFTKDQLFFLNMAGRRCGKARPAQAVRLILTDPHAPTRYRINGALDNVGAFKEAFNCPNKKPTCKIW